VVASKRRFQYEEALAADPLQYDTWFDYIRLEEGAGDEARIREVGGGGRRGELAADVRSTRAGVGLSVVGYAACWLQAGPAVGRGSQLAACARPGAAHGTQPRAQQLQAPPACLPACALLHRHMKNPRRALRRRCTSAR
jgi:hypothetical protein